MEIQQRIAQHGNGIKKKRHASLLHALKRSKKGTERFKASYPSPETPQQEHEEAPGKTCEYSNPTGTSL